MKLVSVVTLFLAAALATGCSKNSGKKQTKRDDGPIPVTLVEVRKVPWERKIRLVGSLFPNQQARIAAEVEGSIEKTLAEVGDVVGDDHELAQIDTASYQGMVNLHTANMAKAQANAENQTENLDRLNQLKKTGAVSPTDYDTAVAAQKQSLAEVAAAKAQLGSAQTALRRSMAKAPFPGAITERLVTEGDFVSPGTVMFQIVDDSVLKFRGEIPEREAAQVKVGQIVRLRVDAYPDRVFEGKVSWINPAVNPDTHGVGIEARVENADRVLKANFFARAELVVNAADPTVVVPLDSIVSFIGVNKVFLVDQDTAQPREVVLGAVDGEDQEILKGLKPGEHVILNGRTKVQPGSRVSVQATAPSST
ncbi:efflux RND transporter periplasmic adaptor subunit [Verrucomicrobiota bacterium sgz303538]